MNGNASAWIVIAVFTAAFAGVMFLVYRNRRQR